MVTGIKIIQGDRQSGRTTELIKESAKTGYPIICSSKQVRSRIKKRAEELNIQIPEPIPMMLDDFGTPKLQMKLKEYDGVLVDDMDNLFDQLLCGKFAGGVINREFIGTTENLLGGFSESKMCERIDYHNSKNTE